MFLTSQVQALKRAADATIGRLEDRTLWMINSTATGGGVAEMLPKIVSLLCQLGVDTEWAVIHPENEKFFPLTKQLHNMVHGAGSPNDLTPDDRRLYEATSRKLADELHEHVKPGDIVIVHDPQPLGAGALLAETIDIHAIWRCHIGRDEDTSVTDAAWEFLQPWIESYDMTVFSLDDYIPPFLQEQSEVIPPGIDPLSHKNRELCINKFTGILSNASLVSSAQPVLTPPFETPARRLQTNDTHAPATQPEDFGLMFRPIIVQISRWDRLKGFTPLLGGFTALKRKRNDRTRNYTDRHRRRLDLARMVLAGPAPGAVQDDPESNEVFRELCDRWHDLDPTVQRNIAIISLPMDSRKINALMVNALQRCATIVVQNSLREGFGLTVTEAMWKRVPVLGTHAAGIRSQIDADVHGQLVQDPEDPREIAEKLDLMLQKPKERDAWATNGQRRVTEKYLVLSQVKHWLEVLRQPR
jgi:trehalose synthase